MVTILKFDDQQVILEGLKNIEQLVENKEYQAYMLEKSVSETVEVTVAYVKLLGCTKEALEQESVFEEEYLQGNIQVLGGVTKRIAGLSTKTDEYSDLGVQEIYVAKE